MRSSTITSADRGGIFDTLLGLVRADLGRAVGNGNQYVSSIHDGDFVRRVDRDDFSGAVNVTAPGPRDAFRRVDFGELIR